MMIGRSDIQRCQPIVRPSFLYHVHRSEAWFECLYTPSGLVRSSPVRSLQSTWLRECGVKNDMLAACNSSRTTLRMLSSSLSACSAARMACTRNSLRRADGACCSNSHARRCCGSPRFGLKPYCGRFMPRSYDAIQRPTRVRIRQRSPLSSSRKIVLQRPSLGLRWWLTTDAPPPSSTAGIACRSKPASIVADSRFSTLPVHDVAHCLADRAG